MSWIEKNFWIESRDIGFKKLIISEWKKEYWDIQKEYWDIQKETKEKIKILESLDELEIPEERQKNLAKFSWQNH